MIRFSDSHFALMLTCSAALHASTLVFPWGVLNPPENEKETLRVTLAPMDTVAAETTAPRPVLRQKRAAQQLQSPKKLLPKQIVRKQPIVKKVGSTIPVAAPIQPKRLNHVEAPDPIAERTTLQRNKAEKFQVSYQQAVVAWLEKHKRYPRRALRRNIEGEGVLSLTLSNKGAVLTRTLKHSSGCDLLDDEITRMVDRAGSFPAIPTEIGKAQMSFVIPVTFQIS